MFEQLPLRDIHLPDPVSWWPPAPGWWVLPVFVALAWVAGQLLLKTAQRFNAKRRLKRAALGELDRIESDFEAAGDPRRTLERLSVLLRRVAVTAFPERGVGGRAGQAWVDWLRRTGPDGLDSQALAPMARAPYRPAPPVAAQPVLAEARRWIEHVTRRVPRDRI